MRLFLCANMTDIYGLIGYPLSHSFSPTYFNEKFEREGVDARYERFELKNIEELTELLQRRPELKGLNVTIPYKTAVLPYLHSLSEAAMVIGAVNCIDIEDGKLNGYNTDVGGFGESLKSWLKNHHKHALVLGTGGASLADGWQRARSARASRVS